ncbi:hypothetical protein Q1695_012175 [Nippostrongylus brasiliensis]|nr:hypothetical protein Q1695_012175 [Nippostrongylus brasiliensis]
MLCRSPHHREQPEPSHRGPPHRSRHQKPTAAIDHRRRPSLPPPASCSSPHPVESRLLLSVKAATVRLQRGESAAIVCDRSGRDGQRAVHDPYERIAL